MHLQTAVQQKTKSWFTNCNELFLFIAVSIIGFECSILCFPRLNGFAFNFGSNLIGAFVPPILTAFYLLAIDYKYPEGRALFAKTLLLYFIQIIPFAPLFFQVFRPTIGDDFERYYFYAKYMIGHHTLYGADDMYWPDKGKTYLTQPGYRYFIALELILFRGLYRFVQFINIGLYILAVFFFQRSIKQLITNTRLRLFILILIFLFTPYAIKNVLMGLPEWLTAVLLMLACYLYAVQKNPSLAILFLGLVPFFRQNNLITIIFLAFWIIVYNRRRLKLLILFLIPLGLPLYHNLYYAGKWTFFVHLFPTPLTYKNNSTGYNYPVLIYNLSRLFGFEITNRITNFSFIAFLFMPYAVVLYFILLRTFNTIKWKLLFGSITLCGILPGLYLGKDYYPRFEYTSVVLVLVSYCFLLPHFTLKKNTEMKMSACYSNV